MSTGLKRNTSDKYYTNINIAKKCTELFKKYIKINENDLIIEPSAGNGSFIPLLKNYHVNLSFMIPNLLLKILFHKITYR